MLAGVPPHAGVRPVEALVRWDPVWAAAGELADRRELALPPASRTALLEGEPATVEAAVAALRGTDLEVLGPLTVASPGSPPASRSGKGAEESPRVRVLLRAREGDAADGGAGVSGGADPLVTAVRRLRAARSLRKSPGVLVSRIDPADLVG